MTELKSFIFGPLELFYFAIQGFLADNVEGIPE